MEKRQAKVLISGVGGTAGKNSKTYKISLPSAWINSLNLGENDREIVISFDGEAIKIEPQKNIERRFNDCAIKLCYYDDKILCSEIFVNDDTKEIYVKNYADNPVKTAFGNNLFPSYDDYVSFLESRCVPRERDGIKFYLENLGISEYNPLEIIKNTKGKMADDNQWLEVKYDI